PDRAPSVRAPGSPTGRARPVSAPPAGRDGRERKRVSGQWNLRGRTAPPVAAHSAPPPPATPPPFRRCSSTIRQTGGAPPRADATGKDRCGGDAGSDTPP